MLMGPGENAGAVDVGGGLAVAFKVESHNHPERGGAVSGRGDRRRRHPARRVRGRRAADRRARLAALRRAGATAQRSRYLLERAVGGIGHYGNSIGVPTVGGEIYFESSYEQNCLVNAMCLGLAPRERLIRSAAAGPGNVLVLLGALTGRDGIGGASVLASAELGEGDDAQAALGADRRSVRREEAAGVLPRAARSRAARLAPGPRRRRAHFVGRRRWRARAGSGLDIDVARVPLREPGMEPFEIMVSESQERMLCVVEPERVDAVLDVCERWETLATPIGDGDRRPTAARARPRRARGRAAGQRARRRLPALRPRAGGARSRPLYGAAAGGAPRRASRRPSCCWRCCSSANLASRRPVFEQYDPIVQSRTVRRPDEADAAVLMLARRAAIAVSIDGNGRRVACDPRRRRRRGRLRVRGEPGLRGRRAARPDQLPELRQSREAARGVAAGRGGAGAGRGVRATRACPSSAATSRSTTRRRAGRSSRRRSSAWSARCRTPARAGRLGFVERGDAIAARRSFEPSLHGLGAGQAAGRGAGGELPPRTSRPSRERTTRSARRCAPGALHSAHDIAEGGIAVALAECCIAGGIGAERRATRRDLEPCSARRPGARSSSRARRRTLARAPPIIGRVGGDDTRDPRSGWSSQFPSSATRARRGCRGTGLGPLLALIR